MLSKYIIIVLSALTLGFGVAFWRATNEIDLQIQAAHMAGMAERSAQEKQLLESKARETAEQAHEKAANRAAEAGQRLAEQIGATKKIEAKLADAEIKLQLANEKIAKQIAARKETQIELYYAEARVRTLNAQLQQETSNKEAAEIARMKAEAEAQVATEKLAVEIKAREAASHSRPASLNHRIAMRGQNQTTALPVPTKTRN